MWDHSWIEVEGQRFDVAIKYPMVSLGALHSSGLIKGLELSSGLPTVVTVRREAS